VGKLQIPARPLFQPTTPLVIDTKRSIDTVKSPVTCVVQRLLAPGSVGNRAGVEDVLVLLTGGRSSDMERTLDEAAEARQAGLHIIVVGIGAWINAVELAGVASYPYSSTRLLLPAGYASLPSVHNQLRDMICNSASI